MACSSEWKVESIDGAHKTGGFSLLGEVIQVIVIFGKFYRWKLHDDIFPYPQKASRSAFLLVLGYAKGRTERGGNRSLGQPEPTPTEETMASESRYG